MGVLSSDFVAGKSGKQSFFVINMRTMQNNLILFLLMLSYKYPFGLNTTPDSKQVAYVWLLGGSALLKHFQGCSRTRWTFYFWCKEMLDFYLKLWLITDSNWIENCRQIIKKLRYESFMGKLTLLSAACTPILAILPLLPHLKASQSRIMKICGIFSLQIHSLGSC